MNNSRLDKLARQILMVDDQNNSIIDTYEKIIDSGLPELPCDCEKKDLLIIGAGIAGLVAGTLLKNAGHNITIIEANDNRIGGRIKTLTPELKNGRFHDPKQYTEAGAMRIPTQHPLVNQYIKKYNLKSQDFYYRDVDKVTLDQKNPTYRTWLKANGIQVQVDTYRKHELAADERAVGFPIEEEYLNVTSAELLEKALAEPKGLVDKTSKSTEEQIKGWTTIIDKYGDYNMRQYLKEFGYSKQVIDYIGTLENLTSRMYLSFIQSFIETTYFTGDTRFIELEGGSWKLPYAFRPDLEENLVMNARVIEIQWYNENKEKGGQKAMHRGKPGVYVKTINEPAMKRGVVKHNHVKLERELTADYLICTVPFSALRFIKVDPGFSYEKSRAIVELHYDSATKVLLEFNERFWEWDEETWRKRIGDEYRGHNAFGGGSITDSPNRFIYFPSHAIEGSRGGVVLASYTWSDDASRWDSIPEEDRYGFALKGLTDIYGKGIKKFFTGVGQTESWMQNFYAFGEAAIFAPGQLTELHLDTSTIEGNIHFAGEHTSLKHAWIEGAIESGIRTALEVHERVLSD